MGQGTRSQLKTFIRKGNVTVNGEVVKSSDFKVDPGKDVVTLMGEIISYVTYEYYMLNKPQGVITATEDAHQETVLDLIVDKSRRDLFPVGRLDKDTEGLLLITNDGDLAHRLLHPKKHVDKTYYALVQNTIGEEEIRNFAKGLDIGDPKPTLPAKLEVLRTFRLEGDSYFENFDLADLTEELYDPRVDGNVNINVRKADSQDLTPEISEIKVVLHEGRFHQVKRMFEAVGSKVLYLKRLNMGSLVLDEFLLPGEYRPLTEKEIEAINTDR